jgi:UDPglucose 6-dehydrogenase
VRITVVGLGYVGLVTAAGLARWDHEVVGLEADPGRLTSLLEGQVPLHEPGLDDLVKTYASSGTLRFSGRAAEAVSGAHAVMVAVGTTDAEGGWQTGTILRCLTEVVPLLADDAVLVVRSTIPPDFVRQLGSIVDEIRDQAGRPRVPVMLNPEFTREAQAVADFLGPDRVVVGVIRDPDGHGVRTLRRVYHRVDAPIIVMRGVDACLSKLGANLFLATKISFANELARLCDAYGGRVDEVVGAMAYDARIGGSFLKAGVGYGGSCLPHQVTQTVRNAARIGIETPLLAAVDQINHDQRIGLVDRLAELTGGDLVDRKIALLGLTFKPGTDDLREAPALTVATLLIERGATVVAYDPMERARVRAAAEVPALTVVGSAMEALEDADAAALVTEWAEFAGLDWDAVAGTMRQPLIVDGRNALAPDVLARAGFTYVGFGRGRMDPEEVGATVPAVAGISAVVAGQTAPATALGLTEATLLGDY